MIVIRRLLWDHVNLVHMVEKHNVNQQEVEEVCHNKPVVQRGKKGRLLVIGSTLAGRILTIILDSKNLKGISFSAGSYYPVTARPAKKRELEIYKSEKGG